MAFDYKSFSDFSKMLKLKKEDEIEFKKNLLAFQFLSLIFVLIGALFVGVIEFYFPNFFNFPYFYFSPNAIAYFWPLFVYATVLSLITAIDITSTKDDNANYLLGALTGLMAGVWEELGFRWVYICFGMIAIMFANWLWGSFFAWFFILLFGFVLIMGVLLVITQHGEDQAKGILMTVFGAIMCPLSFYIHGAFPDPIYWLYDMVVLPVINFVTFGGFSSILIHEGAYPALFIYGAVSANAKFRDGHKYQGPFGIINSWLIGFVMLYTTLNYGLFTAMLLHCLYNFQIHTIHFIVRKTKPTKT